MKMDIFPMVSEVILEVGYSYKHAILLICFKNGSRRIYKDVPEATAEGFLYSESAGHFYNRRIKGFYTSLPCYFTPEAN